VGVEPPGGGAHLIDADDGNDDVIGPRRGRAALFTAIASASCSPSSSPSWRRASRPPRSWRTAPCSAAGRGHRRDVPRLGEEFDLADERGRWVVVNFFATWCVPCREEHPDLVRFAAAHERPDDARVVSVVFSDQPADVERFFAERGGDWPVIDDTTGVVPSWGVTGVPESYLVDPGGFVVAKIVGGITTEGLEELLARAQAGPEPS
jgi:thiol-disulfide isomerase/thioredoxin